MKDLFRGELVRFLLEEPDVRAKAEVRWQRDTEFNRLADSEPSQLSSEKKIKGWFEKQSEDGFKPERYSFSIRTLEEDKHIGFLGLWVDLHPQRGLGWTWHRRARVLEQGLRLGHDETVPAICLCRIGPSAPVAWAVRIQSTRLEVL